MGGEVPESEFPALSRQASAYIDAITSGKIQTATEEVKNACCAVCDELYRAKQDGGIIQSESKGEWSVTYADRQSAEARLRNAARVYLANTGLLYRGTR